MKYDFRYFVSNHQTKRMNFHIKCLKFSYVSLERFEYYHKSKGYFKQNKKRQKLFVYYDCPLNRQNSLKLCLGKPKLVTGLHELRTQKPHTSII